MIDVGQYFLDPGGGLELLRVWCEQVPLGPREVAPSVVVGSRGVEPRSGRPRPAGDRGLPQGSCCVLSFGECLPRPMTP